MNKHFFVLTILISLLSTNISAMHKMPKAKRLSQQHNDRIKRKQPRQKKNNSQNQPLQDSNQPILTTQDHELNPTAIIELVTTIDYLMKRFSGQ